MQQQTIPAFAIFDDYRPTVGITVATRWLLLGAWMAMINYREVHDSVWVAFNSMGTGMVVANAYVSWRIIAGKTITWHHALSLSLLDLMIITAALFMAGGFQNRFFVFYYPALLGFSLMFPRRASFSVLVLVITLYIAMALTINPTLNLDLRQEKVLVIRLVTMVGIVVKSCGNSLPG